MEWAPQLRLLPVSAHKVCSSGWCRQALQLNPGALLFGFLLLLIILLHPLQEAASALPVFDVLSPPGQNLALNSLVHSDAHGMLGDSCHSHLPVTLQNDEHKEKKEWQPQCIFSRPFRKHGVVPLATHM